MAKRPHHPTAHAVAPSHPPAVAPSAPTAVLPEYPDGPIYPGGEDMPAYRWAFNAFAVLFLLLVCIGLASYLGSYLSQRWG